MAPTYLIHSYISLPAVRPDWEHFDILCAMGRHHRIVSERQTLSMVRSFADPIAMRLDGGGRQDLSDRALTNANAEADLREQFMAVPRHDLRNAWRLRARRRGF